MSEKALSNTNWDEYGDKRSPSRNRLLFTEHRLTTVKFIDYFKDIDTGLILDAGCGDGFWLEILRNIGFSDLFGIDLSYSLLTRARDKGFRVAQYDLIDMGFSRQFDVIIMCDVLEHLPDMPRALDNICNNLKENGIFYLVIPVYDSLSSRYQRFFHRNSKIEEAREHDETHLHALSKSSIISLLGTHGFQIEKTIYTANRLPFISGKIQKFTFGNRFGNWLTVIARKR